MKMETKVTYALDATELEALRNARLVLGYLHADLSKPLTANSIMKETVDRTIEGLDKISAILQRGELL